jgi:UDP-N-acetylglucosamine 2-epimerase (non-hydrolysing)
LRLMTILGTRPEVIRLSLIIKKLDEYSDHILVHTGQNYDDRLSGIFFRELGLRSPDVSLGIRGTSFADQAGQIIVQSEKVFREYHPDRLLILGDTNTGLSSLVARRLGMSVYHMEAGNRCYDDRVPEEVNRRVIDHSSSVLMPYTHRSRENLLKEGISGEQIYVVGNPINEVIDHYEREISSSTALDDYGLEEGKFFLATMHRAENVDIPQRLKALVDALALLHSNYKYPVICSFHPHTRDRVLSFGVDIRQAGLRFVEPLGFFDFIRLEKSAFCIISDSGTVQEEACIFKIPNVTIRDVTERPETLECGSNILAGADPEQILSSISLVTGGKCAWRIPPEYKVDNVSETVCRIILSKRIDDLAEVEWRSSS